MKEEREKEREKKRVEVIVSLQSKEAIEPNPCRTGR